MGSVSGLAHKDAALARDGAVEIMHRLLTHKDQVHYTEGADRWSAINGKLVAADGHLLKYGDCSSTVTWAGWNVMGPPLFKVGDVFNRLQFKGGYTGTLARNGRPVTHPGNVLGFDLVLYGSAAPYLHVAAIVDVKNGKPWVISHGSEAGPYLEPFDYRPDVAMIRRYI